MTFKTSDFQVYDRNKQITTVDKITEEEAKQEVCRLMQLIDDIESALSKVATAPQRLIEDWRDGR